MKKVLIMTVPFGGGHYATAAKISALLKDADQSLSIEVIDVITDGWPSFSRRSSEAYVKSTANSGGFWYAFYYRLTDWCPWPLRWFASLAFRRYAKRKLAEVNPDLIIATFPFLGHVAWRARRKLGSAVPIVTVVTDAGNVQGVWLIGHEDEILTATSDTVDYARRRHLGGDRVQHVGFPVSQAFHDVPPLAEAKRQLGLDPERFTVLVTSGGLGMSAEKVKRLVTQLAESKVPLQLICVAGKNQALKAAYEAMEVSPSVTLKVLGYTDNMPLVMAASDIICSKSGWLTISEALAVKRPLYLFDVIPGQEEENAHYVTHGNLGVLVPNPDTMATLVIDTATHPERLTAMKSALEEQADGTCSRRLTQHFLALLDERPV